MLSFYYQNVYAKERKFIEAEFNDVKRSKIESQRVKYYDFALKNSESVYDFGCGAGYLLESINNIYSKIKLYI